MLRNVFFGMHSRQIPHMHEIYQHNQQQSFRSAWHNKKSLNRLTGHRLVPIQEAVHEIAGLDLVICSDNLYSFSLGKANALMKNGQQAAHDKKCLASSYRNRPSDSKHFIGNILLRGI